MRLLILIVGGALVLEGCRCGHSETRSDAEPATRPEAPDCGTEPGPDELDPSPLSARQQGFETSIDYFRDLARRYPRSARAHHRAGFAAQHASEPNLSEALRHYQAALELHHQGCPLPEDEQWRSYEGLGLTYLMLDQPEQAVRWLQPGAEHWPTIPQTHYNLACARCLSHDLEGCHQAFVRALEAADARQAPAFIEEAGSVDYFVRTSRNDPDLARLREDPRYQAALVPYLDPGSPPDAEAELHRDAE